MGRQFIQRELTRAATTTTCKLGMSHCAVKIPDSTVSSMEQKNLRKLSIFSFSVYVPINPRLGERQLTITINTRNGNGNGVRPNWNIAVHQFECPLGQSRSLKAVDSAQGRALNPTPRTLVSDWLAPAGCLQYFVEPTGQIDSFNFNNGAGQLRAVE